MEIGARINDQYQVVEHIGRGGMADVWSARDERLRRMVAIKTIAPNLGADIDPVALFEREAHTIARMEHPHILPIYGFGEYEQSLFIIMRYVTGGSLEDLLRQGPLTPEEVLRMGENIARALDYAHENNVVHLDLKPPNILLDSAHSPYLADFGLATVIDPQGRARNPGSGTLLFMAPEQMISDTIDYRADIYAFSVMLFHMFTGTLPFDGAVPLAMRQLQAGQSLPDISKQHGLPMEISDLLRVGTAKEPANRPQSHMAIMEQLREVLQPGGVTLGAAGFQVDEDFEPGFNPFIMPTEQMDGEIDSALLEAVDIYTRARHNWRSGQGRFLLGATHYMLMAQYYQDADEYGLNIDRQGYQMLLRGALEYDHEIDYWWAQITDEDRRWVCLHTLRSGSSPARMRALYRLETLPDDDSNPVIPSQVAQALELETEPAAKIAALVVLGTRARLIKRTNVAIKTEYRGRLLSSMTRLGIQMQEPALWQETVYSDDVDMLIAEHAFDEDENVAEFAARTVGRMRSLAGVQYISAQQKEGREGSLEALAFVRDEAPSLPREVSREARFYAWIANTVRRLTDDPLGGLTRFALALIGGWIGMGDHIYTLFFSEQLFNSYRWANTLAMGLTFGLFIGLTFLLTDEFERRLSGFWPWWMRLVTTGALGFGMATLSFTSFRWLFMHDPEITWDLMRLTGFALSFALVATALLRLRGWIGVLLTTTVIFLPVLAAYRAFYFPDSFTIAPAALIGLWLGVIAGWRALHLTPVKPEVSLPGGRWLSLILIALAGIGWSIGVWWYYDWLVANSAAQPITWDTVLLMVSGALLLGFFIAYYVRTEGRIAFLLLATVAFGTLYALNGWQFFDFTQQIPFVDPPFTITYYDGTPLTVAAEQPLFNYNPDKLTDIYTVTLPMLLVIALGVNMPALLDGWLGWIGQPQQTGKKRGGWLSLTLIYMMVMTALISVLALFSAHVDVAWALGWSVWGFVTFVLALAAYRWARWGAQGLIFSGMLLIAGGFFFDWVYMRAVIASGDWPSFLQSINLPGGIVTSQLAIWGLWGAGVAFCAWGALRRELWAGIGTLALIAGWLLVAVFTSLVGSVAIFALLHVTLLAYVLLPKYPLMEADRFMLPDWVLFFSLDQDSPSPDDPLQTRLAPAAPPTIGVGTPSQINFDMQTVQAANVTERRAAQQEGAETAPWVRVDTGQLMTQPPAMDPDTKTMPPGSVSFDDEDKPLVRFGAADMRNMQTMRFEDDPASPETTESATDDDDEDDESLVRFGAADMRNMQTMRFDDDPTSSETTESADDDDDEAGE